MTSKECRICLRHEENCVSLFTKRRGTKLAEIIRFCARIEIYEDDGLPEDACSRCVDEALNAYLFVNKCRRSDAELRTAQAFCKESNAGDDPDEEVYCSVAQSIKSASASEKDPFAESVENCVTISKLNPEMKSLSSSGSVNVILPEANESSNRKEYDEQINITKVEEPFATLIEESDMVESQLMFNENDDEEIDEFLVEYLDDEFKIDSQREASVGNDQALESEQDEVNQASTPDDCQGSGKKFICCGIRCKAILNTHQELEMHTYEVHLVHRERESREKPYECSRCYARFHTAKSLSLHNRKLSHCPLCLQVCFSQREKRLHMHDVHGESISLSSIQKLVKICCGCHESFQNEEDLRLHSEEKHAIRKSAVDASRPLQCDVCYKLFRTLESLRIHQRFVYRPKNFVCSICNRAFDTRSKLTSHELVHSDQRNFQCDKCDKSFKKSIDLRSHQLLHNEKREECTVCGLRFHRKSNLKMHMRKHQDTFFYACPDCPKQFKNNSHLKEHYKVHSKQKPYSCSYCERSFAYCSDKKRHEMSHTGNYPFECHCSKKFARKTTYDKHVVVCQDRIE
ncbi:zinc finger protein ZFP2-like [Malaya genurostris]|uniref:zinc finger protein ZFP2-like n=1 Tax=Malaya genurostris TaxID=325434 RepID=UPI0026F3B595|nr:zinc finger protein ZFP2-like [Malaya genurostris]